MLALVGEAVDDQVEGLGEFFGGEWADLLGVFEEGRWRVGCVPCGACGSLSLLGLVLP